MTSGGFQASAGEIRPRNEQMPSESDQIITPRVTRSTRARAVMRQHVSHSRERLFGAGVMDLSMQ